MTRSSKIDRARRNALKGAGLVGAFLTASMLPSRASASSMDDLRRLLEELRNRNSRGGRCFVRGTQVRTRVGYRPIETLQPGDEVAVHFAGFAPVKAMARHTLNSVSGQWDGDGWNRPVVIRRGALGENMPAADLCLTALHQVYVDGFLVKAGDLVNGESIAFVPANGHDTLDFFGIELERHDILDVQGAFCDSVRKAEMEICAPVLAFGGGRERLYSHLRSVASLVVDRRQPIDIIRDRLDERAADLAEAA